MPLPWTHVVLAVGVMEAGAWLFAGGFKNPIGLSWLQVAFFSLLPDILDKALYWSRLTRVSRSYGHTPAFALALSAACYAFGLGSATAGLVLLGCGTHLAGDACCGPVPWTWPLRGRRAFRRSPGHEPSQLLVIWSLELCCWLLAMVTALYWVLHDQARLWDGHTSLWDAPLTLWALLSLGLLAVDLKVWRTDMRRLARLVKHRRREQDKREAIATGRRTMNFGDSGDSAVVRRATCDHQD